MEFGVAPNPSHRPRLGLGLDTGWAERRQQATVFSELSLLREDTVWRTSNLVDTVLSAYLVDGEVGAFNQPFSG